MVKQKSGTVSGQATSITKQHNNNRTTTTSPATTKPQQQLSNGKTIHGITKTTQR